jgi:uncharacterized protein YdeI (YjbR/CyaY-like superfamily)
VQQEQLQVSQQEELPSPRRASEPDKQHHWIFRSSSSKTVEKRKQRHDEFTSKIITGNRVNESGVAEADSAMETPHRAK